jgi:predicted ATP-grasp superfamily ATP-dependent carboligase
VKELGGTPQKVVFADTREQLMNRFPRMMAHSPQFLVQQAIPGSDEEIFSYHAYYNEGSRPLGEFVGRKVRTYPPASGISTYLRLVREDSVIDLGRNIADKLQITGVVKMDFKRDPKSSRLFLMEINPRYNLWHYLGAMAGVNLPELAHLDLAGQASTPFDGGYRTDLHWLSFRDDLRSLKMRHAEGWGRWLPWLLSLRHRKIYNTFAWNDPGPWLAIQRDRARRLLAS